MVEMPGLWAGTRVESGRFREVQSSMNWQRVEAAGVLLRIWHVGWTLATAFMSSGRSLLLTSMVALHTTRTCSIDSTGASQREQAGLRVGWSIESLSLVRNSPVRNFKWRWSFLASWVMKILWSAGWAAPVRPLICTFRYFILEFLRESFLSSFSYHTVNPTFSVRSTKPK